MRHITLALLLSFVAVEAFAQEGTVTGVGVATIERQPNLLRAQVDLIAEGKDMKDALSKLREMESAARKKLADLGADEKSVTVGPVRDGGARSARQQQMEFYVRQQMGGRRKPATSPAAAAVKLSSSLKADWALTGNGDELLTQAADLTQKIKDSDIAGKKLATAALTPEQQEQLEEQQAMAQQAEAMSGEAGSGSSTEAKFTYVATLTEDDQLKASAEAFSRAKSQAERLATAAGAHLGSLRGLSATTTVAADPSTAAAQYGYVYSAMGVVGGVPVESANEAVGSSPSSVSVRVTVNASFALK